MTIALSIIALLSAVVAIYAKARENNRLQYVFKPLTMLAIILLAILNVSAPPTFYQKMIIAGLIFSTAGDVFLIDSRRFIQGLTSFLIAHVCFIIAFFSTPNLAGAFFYIAYVAFFLAILWKHLGSLKIPVVLYSIALALMSWFALSRYLQSNDAKSLFAFLGSVSFLASDSLLAFNKFKSPFPLGEISILSTYFAAQWLIALSI